MQLATQKTKRQPKDGRQTIAREIGLSKTGRGRQPKQKALVYGIDQWPNRAFKHTIQRKRPLWFMVSTNNGERGRVKGLKNKNLYRSRSRILPGIGRSCLLSAFGYGAVKESGGQNRTLSSSVRLTRTAAKKQRPHKETKTGR